MKLLFLLLCVTVSAYGADKMELDSADYVRVEQYGSAQVYIPHDARPEIIAIARQLARAQGLPRVPVVQKQQDKATPPANVAANAGRDAGDNEDLGGVVLPLCILL